MDSRRWERMSAFSGLLFVALVAIGLAIVPQRPDLSDQAGLVGYVTAERTSLLWQAYLNTAAVFLLVWFAGSIRTHLKRNEGEPGRFASIAYGGAIIFASVTMVITVVNATAAFRPTPTGVVFLNDIAAVSLALGWIPIGITAAATAIGGMRARALPTWHGAYGMVVAIATLLSPALLFGESGFWSVDRIDASLVMLALVGLWVTATSLLLIVGEAAEVQEESVPHEGWHLRKAVGL
jgi:hypothetical protein